VVEVAAAVVPDPPPLPDVEVAAVDEPHAAIRTTRASSPQRTRTPPRLRTGPITSK
jgi:hypothetical protein